MTSSREVVLTIAGSDPTGGAGLEADLALFARCGLDGTAVATALTTQDSARVHDLGPVDPEAFARRLAILLDDLVPRATKVGLLATRGIAASLATVLAAHDWPGKLVIDPIINSSSGLPLIDDAGLDVLRRELLPRATLVTPNRAEAARLLGRETSRAPDLLARELSLSLGIQAVLVTGGDAGTEVCVRDFLFRDGCVTMLEAPRVPGPSPHGTGCALTASITALLARGRSLEAAIMTAREWVGRAIAAATILGAVNGARPRLVVGGDKE